MVNPLVSICIPTYNGALFLQESLNSILVQTYKNFEVVVSDDASTDKTLGIIEQFKEEASFPVYIYYHKPNGIGANWNNCVKHANGEYIKFLFQDDVLESTCLEKMVAVAIANQKIGIVYSKRSFIYDRALQANIEWIKVYGNLHRSWKSVIITGGKAYSGKELLKDENLLKVPVNKVGEPTAVLLKKEVFKKVGFFSTSLKQTLDIEYWYRVMKYYDIIFIDESLVAFRLHQNQTTNKNAKIYFKEEKLFNEAILSHLFWQIHKKDRRRIFFNYTYLGLISKKYIYIQFKVWRKLKSIFL